LSSNPTQPIVPRALLQTELQILNDIFVGGFYADKVLERQFKLNRKLGSRDRKFLAETTYEIVRWLGLIDGVIKKLALQLFDDAQTLNQARLLVYKLLFDQVDLSASNTDVFSSPKLWDFKRGLRGMTLEDASRDLKPWERLAFPQWLYEKLGGSAKESLLRALNEPAPVCLRANRLKTTREEAQKRLGSEDIPSHFSKISEDALILNERKNIFTTQAFKDGLIEVQDEGSQRIAPFLDVAPGQRVVDTCAGGGGKTLHLAALMQNKGSLVAMDVHDKKLEQLKLRARRAGVSNLRIQLIDSTKVIKRAAESFDRVLLDVPCSGTGVIRRNPDTKWKLRAEDIENLKQVQLEILSSYSKMTKKGGKLVYATCSLLREENMEVVEKFLSGAGRNSGWCPDTEPLVLTPDKDGCDGFFAIRLERKS